MPRDTYSPSRRIKSEHRQLHTHREPVVDAKGHVVGERRVPNKPYVALKAYARGYDAPTGEPPAGADWLRSKRPLPKRRKK